MTRTVSGDALPPRQHLRFGKGRALINWFEFGVRDRNELLGLLADDFSGAA
jgi:hypothetical protein